MKCACETTVIVRSVEGNRQKGKSNRETLGGEVCAGHGVGEGSLGLRRCRKRFGREFPRARSVEAVAQDKIWGGVLAEGRASKVGQGEVAVLAGGAPVFSGWQGGGQGARREEGYIVQARRSNHGAGVSASRGRGGTRVASKRMPGMAASRGWGGRLASQPLGSGSEGSRVESPPAGAGS